MNLIKMGNFIKELRSEKNITQEQLAERFSVSRRTVSRWETGSNLPDMLCQELASHQTVSYRADYSLMAMLRDTVLG